MLELYEQGKSVRAIAKEVHMSFRDIGAITRAANEGSEPGPQQRLTGLSKDSQALDLFSQGRRPVEVIVALDLGVPEVEKLYKDYLRLSGLGKLALLYEEFKHSLPSFLKLYNNLTSERKLSNNDIENIIKYSIDIPLLKIKYQNLISEVHALEKKKMAHLTELRTLQETLSDLEMDIAQAKNELSSMDLQ